jgi:hypothetical protein
VSQYDWGGDYADSLTSLDPLSSMMGELDYDVNSAPANGEKGFEELYVPGSCCTWLHVYVWVPLSAWMFALWRAMTCVVALTRSPA